VADTFETIFSGEEATERLVWCLMDELGVKACTPAFKDISSVAVASGENFIFK